MSKTTLILLVCFVYCVPSARAQTDSTSTLTVTVGQDSYFGFYVSAFATYAWKDKTSIIVYNNYWANPAFGNLTTGTDFWTEVGTGLDFGINNGDIHISPMVGFTYGKVLSGGERGVVGDGIVPSITVALAKRKLSLTASATWFKALRKEGPVTIDYVWTWANALYPVSKKVQLGILSEQFMLSRMTDADQEMLYAWVGPLVQFNFLNNTSLKISGGFDSVNDEYFKANLIIPFAAE